MATEADKYEGFRQKLENICDENGLIYTFNTEGYPIMLTIQPQQGLDAQISMLEMDDEKPFNFPDATIQFIMEDGALTLKMNERFTLPETLFTKIKNLFVKMVGSFLGAFYRDVREKNLLVGPYVMSKGSPASNEKFKEPLEEFEEDEAAGDAPEGEDFPDDLLEDEPGDGKLTHREWLIRAATKYVRETGKCVLADLRKKFTLGYADAARLVDDLADANVVGDPVEGGGRAVLPFPVEEVG